MALPGACGAGGSVIDWVMRTEANTYLSCSFCGKNQSQVLKLIAGPGVYICHECICLCVDIIAEEMAEQDGDEATVAGRLHDELEQLRGLISAKRRG